MNYEPITNNKYVSRGGLKLEHAIRNWKLDIGNYVVLDVGSSTGGFVDCLLQNGAQKVYSVDTAYGELAWKLRNDPRVVVMERTNILHLTALPVIASDSEATSINPEHKGSQIDNGQLVDLITIDASWTKLELILPIVKKFLKKDGKIIALLKPHYEADKSMLIKGVLPEELLDKVKEKVVSKINDLGFTINEEIESPILGGGGNKELLVFITG